MSCQAERAYTIAVVAVSSGGRQVARDQVIVYVNGSVYQEMVVFSNMLPQTQWVWDYIFKYYSQSANIGDVSLMVPRYDPKNAAAKVPFADWWSCVVSTARDCANLSRIYGP